MGRTHAICKWDFRVGANECAIRNTTCSTRVSDDVGVDSKNVSHGEECGGSRAELGGEGGVSLGELEALPDSASSHESV